MSRRQLSRQQAISKEEFAGAGKMERLYWHVLYPFDFQLTDKEQKYLGLLRMVFAVISDELSRNRALQKIEQLAGAEMHPVVRLYNDSEYLFGSMVQTNKTLDRARLWEKYIHLAELAEEAGELETARASYDSAAKIKSLWKDDFEAIDWSKIQPPDIEISSDPQVLKEGVNAETIDYEEEDLL